MDLSFKQYYYSSKQQLLEAAQHAPVVVKTYSIKKYCSLQLTEGEDWLGLRPKYKIEIEWLYENEHDPTPVKIRLASTAGKASVPSTQWLPISTQKTRFLRWLRTNASEDTE